MSELENRPSVGASVVRIVAAVGIVFGVFAAINIPCMMESRPAAEESAAIATLRTLVTVQTLFRDGSAKGTGVIVYADNLGKLAAPPASLIDSVLATGTKQGYRYELTAPDPERSYGVHAEPVKNGPQRRSFYVDESGVLRYSRGRRAGPGATPVGL